MTQDKGPATAPQGKQGTSGDARVDALLQYLIEDACARHIQVPGAPVEKRALLRALVNTRPPRPVPAEIQALQDAFLQEELAARGVVDAEALAPVRPGESLYLWQGDITRLAAGAIVNAANSALLGCFVPGHSCIDNAIHTAAGMGLRAACAEIMEAQGHPEPQGTAKLTPGFNLPAAHVLHTVGPTISGPLTGADCETLASCYRACLELALAKGLASVAFCCISTGEFCFPPTRAAEIAVQTVRETLEANNAAIQVVFTVFKDSDYWLYKRLLDA